MQRGLARLLYCCSLSVEVADRHSGKVAQPAHRVKDKRLRRAFGILDTARRLGFVMVKGLLPTPVEQGLTLRSLGDGGTFSSNSDLRAYRFAAF